MNVDELLKFQPTKPLDGQTRSSRDADETGGVRKKFKPNLEHLSERQRIEVLKTLENEPEGEVLNETGLKKLLNQFDKRVTKNQEMRIKFPENPEKFMESEVELNSAIQELHVISTRPDLYPYLLDSNSIELLLSILSHENIDIVGAVISFLQELADLDPAMESVENIKALVDYLCEHQIISLLIGNLERFDEKNKDEQDAVHNSLSIFENILELKATISTECAKQGLLSWLLKRIKIKGFDGNKLYAAELLSILVQSDDENRKLLGELNGIDVLLQQIACYKKHSPSSAEESEYMENLFDILCSCLLLASNRIKFLEGEGLQLMRLILRDQKNARNSALKVLSYAMNNLEGKENCQAFVEILGLAVLFPLFMKPEKKDKKKKENATYNNEEHIVSIIASMLKNCNETNKQRVVFKFIENDHEKVDRLLELYFKYAEKVDKIELLSADEDEDEDEIKMENYLLKLENGLFALQHIVYIIMDISAYTDSIKSRVNKLLNLRNVGKSKLIEVIEEYAENLGEGEDKSEEVKEELNRINQLVEQFKA